jgi:hypothetical protein
LHARNPFYVFICQTHTHKRNSSAFLSGTFDLFANLIKVEWNPKKWEIQFETKAHFQETICRASLFNLKCEWVTALWYDEKGGERECEVDLGKALLLLTHSLHHHFAKAGPEKTGLFLIIDFRNMHAFTYFGEPLFQSFYTWYVLCFSVSLFISSHSVSLSCRTVSHNLISLFHFSFCRYFCQVFIAVCSLCVSSKSFRRAF